MHLPAGDDRPSETSGSERVTTSRLRVVVMSCGDLGREVAARLEAVPEVSEVALVTAPYRVPERGRLERLLRSLRYDGVASTVGAVFRRLGRGALSLFTGARSRGDVDGTGPELPASVQSGRFEAFESAECLEWLRAFGPDLGVVAGTHLLPASVFDLPRLGSINVHMGRAPEYRGSAPAFWELYNGESTVGVTVHRVTEELDGGAILAQEGVPLDPVPSGDPMNYLERYRREVLRPTGIRMLVDAVTAIGAGEAEVRPQNAAVARTWPRPRRRAVWALRGRVLRRRVAPRVKDFLGRALFATGLHRRLLRDRATIVLFHRVDDALAPDPLTCDRKEFREYCDFFARHFDVVPLTRLLDALEGGAELTAKLAITFDDGYRDNHRAAAPELERQGLPATFFVATALLGSATTPWWDRHLPSQPEWMSWEEARELAGRGFALGAHTRTHADLGRVEGEEAREEIEGARRDLVERAGVEPELFSYPYGGPDHLTEANRRRVRQAGYRCCLSAHGGVVGPQTDLHRLPRIPVSDWYVSPYHFGAEVVLEAVRDAASGPSRRADPRGEAS